MSTRFYALKSPMTDLNYAFAARDLANIWHPCSQMKDYKEHYPLIPIREAEGAWLTDMNGKRYFDVVSSWWVNLLGHKHPVITQAVKDQLDQLEHIIFAGFTHEPAVTLAEKLVEITPEKLQKVFFADNGSAAVEVALKMAYHAHYIQGKPKKSRFVALQNSYHGETLGALSVGDVALYRETYAPLLLTPIIAPGPDSYLKNADETAADFALRQANELEQIFEAQHDEIAAIILEPLVQCAGNMRMYDPVYLKRVRELCDQYDIYLILDEIAVGFGRTGTLFASEQAGITGDFMCLSKGLTGGYLPLAVTMTTNEMYDLFYDDYQTLKAFLHSHSYTGNPLACAAAKATLNVLQKESVVANNIEKINKIKEVSIHFKNHPNIGDVRQTGMVLALEMVQKKANTGDKKDHAAFDWRERRGMRVYESGLEQGALLRPLGNVVYWMPPFCITDKEIDWLAGVTEKAIAAAVKD